MTLLMITVGGALVGACVIGMLESAWRREPGKRRGSAGIGYRVDPLAVAVAVAVAEDREREATARLFAGLISTDQYQAIMAALAENCVPVLNRPAR